MVPEHIEAAVSAFLDDQQNGDPTRVLRDYFRTVSFEAEAEQTEELMTLIKERVGSMSRLSAPYDTIPGAHKVYHYAYPLLHSLLDLWVPAVYNASLQQRRGDQKQRQELWDRLSDGIKRWSENWFSDVHETYTPILDKLVPQPELPELAGPKGNVVFNTLKKLVPRL